MTATHTIYRDGQLYPLFIDLAAATPGRQCYAYILPAGEEPLRTEHKSYGSDGEQFECVNLTMRQAVYDLDSNSLLLTTAREPKAGQEPNWIQVTLGPSDLNGQALEWNETAGMYTPIA